MPKRKTVFYAYPSEPPAIGETINAATDKLKENPEIVENNVRFKPWPELDVSGKPLVSTIIGNIDRSQVFACDLTYPNRNVSFELGYAIARFKRVFASLDPSIKDAERAYKALYFNLLGMGYSQYQNREELATAFESEGPWKQLDQTMLGERYRSKRPRPEKPTLLYVKPPITSDSVIATLEQLEKSVFGSSIIVDDPKEGAYQSLDWYADQILTADAVIVHLLSTAQIGQINHNIEASLVAGLAHGLGRPLLMLAHAPFDSPIDYEKLIKIHNTAQTCIDAVEVWLTEVGAHLPRRRSTRRIPAGVSPTRLDLRSLFLGQSIAEQERYSLEDYFVETGAFYRALEGPTTMLIGRRGTGKTANLYGIASELGRDRHNHVTILKPAGYETHGLMRILDEFDHRSERGYLIESLWKYLIYSEVALSLEKAILERPRHLPRTDRETQFLEYCETNGTLLSPPFSERMRNAVNSLTGIGSINEIGVQRVRISEELHGTVLQELRRHVGFVLTNTNTLAILIDGLDDPWAPGEYIDHLSELIGGLLRVAQDIPADFGRADSRNLSVDTRITVLLRSDIFAFVQTRVIEQDKLPIERTIWSDTELLLRVLNQRLVQGAPERFGPREIWEELFPLDVVGVTSPEFILRTALPRPRDVIHLTKAAITNVINREHGRVEPDDLLTAREQYSEWVFHSILKEDDPKRGKLESILYEFAGAKKTIDKGAMLERMAVAGVRGEEAESYVNLLCDIGFLGIQTADGFRYSQHEEERHTMREVARRRAKAAGKQERFEINAAFYHVLQID